MNFLNLLNLHPLVPYLDVHFGSRTKVALTEGTLSKDRTYSQSDELLFIRFYIQGCIECQGFFFVVFFKSL